MVFLFWWYLRDLTGDQNTFFLSNIEKLVYLIKIPQYEPDLRRSRSMDYFAKKFQFLLFNFWPFFPIILLSYVLKLVFPPKISIIKVINVCLALRTRDPALTYDVSSIHELALLHSCDPKFYWLLRWVGANGVPLLLPFECPHEGWAGGWTNPVGDPELWHFSDKTFLLFSCKNS